MGEFESSASTLIKWLRLGATVALVCGACDWRSASVRSYRLAGCQETGRPEGRAANPKTYLSLSGTPPFGRWLLVLCGHAFRQKRSNSMTLIPLLVDANTLLTVGFRQCLELGLESVGEVAFGRYMRKKMRDIGEVGSLGAESALERDSGRVTLEELHGCNGGHYLGSGSQSGVKARNAQSLCQKTG